MRSIKGFLILYTENEQVCLLRRYVRKRTGDKSSGRASAFTNRVKERGERNKRFL